MDKTNKNQNKNNAVLQVFEDYQKARIAFVQRIAELSNSQKNIDALYSANVIPLLKPLLLDVVPSIQQSAALAIGRLSCYSEDLARSVAENDIVTQLTQSLPKSTRFFKKAACFVLKSVAQHSVELCHKVVEAGAIEPLVNCLDEYDPSVKEAAAFALGHIAKHNQELAHLVVEARAVDSLLLCLQEPEIVLKRVASQTLAYICQHTEQLAQSVAENGLDVITQYLNYTDTAIKRNVCHLLTNICKHSDQLATLVLSKLSNPQKLLNCLKDQDIRVRYNASHCICQIVNKNPETATAIFGAGAPKVLIEFISQAEKNARLSGILIIAYISQYNEDMAMQFINNGAVDLIRDSMENGNDQIKSACCFCLTHLGRHSPTTANEVSKNGTLEQVLYYFRCDTSSDDLKDKAKHTLIEIISKCSNLQALEPLIHESNDVILQRVLKQFVTHLKGNQPELNNFIRNGGLKAVLTKRPNAEEPLLHLCEEIIAYYPDEIVNYYSPGYADVLLSQIDEFNAQKEKEKEEPKPVEEEAKNASNTGSKQPSKVTSAKKKTK